MKKIKEELTLDVVENVPPNGSDVDILNASLALFVAKGSCSPNSFTVLVSVALEKTFFSFIPFGFFISYLHFLYVCQKLPLQFL